MVEPRTGAREKKLFSTNPTSEYVDIDHVETERVRQVYMIPCKKILASFVSMVQQLEQAEAAPKLSKYIYMCMHCKFTMLTNVRTAGGGIEGNHGGEVHLREGVI